MKHKLFSYLVGSAIWVLASVSYGAQSPEATWSLASVTAPQGVRVAKAAEKKKAGGREKFLTGEGRSKKGTKTKIDFDDANIDGSRRTPAGVAITKNDPNRDYNLINLRTDWKSEMVQSASGLETGKGR